jgi:hypothetical protein
LKRAVEQLQVKSRTVEGPPLWIESSMGGSEIYHSDYGKRIELKRGDVHRWVAEFQSRSIKQRRAKQAPNQRRKPLSVGEDGVIAAVRDLWPSRILPAGVRASDQDNRICEWLKKNGRTVLSTRTVQRVLKKFPGLLRSPT